MNTVLFVPCTLLSTRFYTFFFFKRKALGQLFLYLGSERRVLLNGLRLTNQGASKLFVLWTCSAIDRKPTFLLRRHLCFKY